MGEQIKITIPQGWDEVTIERFQMLQTLKDVKEYESQLTYMIDVISILADVDVSYISGINMENLNLIANDMGWLQEDIKSDKKEVITVDGVEYKWKGKFNELTVGEMISIEQVIDLEELSYNMSFDVIMAILLRKIKEDGTLEEFDAKSFEVMREKFSKLMITEIYGMIVFFSLGVKSFMSNIQESSVPAVTEKKTNSSQKRSWLWKRK